MGRSDFETGLDRQFLGAFGDPPRVIGPSRLQVESGEIEEVVEGFVVAADVADPGAVAGLAVFEAVAAMDPPAAAIAQPADPFDVDVDQFAGPVAFVAADRGAGGPVEPGQAVQAMTGQYRMNGRGRHAQQRGQAARAALEAGA